MNTQVSTSSATLATHWPAEATRADAAVTDNARGVAAQLSVPGSDANRDELDAAGHRGRIVALSRRGQIPRSHADFEPAPVELDELPLGDVGALWRWQRRRAGEVGWRAAIDSWRPHSHAIWRSLDTGEQRRFMRHARPWWDVHRHRIAPQVAKQVADMVGEGRLEIVAGRIGAMRENENGLEVEISRRGHALPPTPSRKQEGETRIFAAAFNCTGPLGTISRTRDPMLRQMLEEQLVRADALGIGLAVDDGSRAGVGVWALGPLTKGAYWEIVAVPDIRGQAAAVAEAIAMELKQ